MKKIILSSLLLTIMPTIGFGQVLGKYEFYGNDQTNSGYLNTNPSESQSLSATYVADHCLTLSKISPVDNQYTPLERSWSTATYDSSTTFGPTSAGGYGLSGNHADCFSGWSASYSNSRTLSFDLTFSNNAVGSLSGISFDIGNYGQYPDPDKFKLVVLRDGQQIYSSSGNSITNQWQNKQFNLSGAVSNNLLSSSAGETTTFTFKIGAYGTNVSSNGMIAMDNIQLLGKHQCVPEPSSSALLALAGIAFGLRRRR